ncbi:MAG TPA: glycosyltransferase, partial [Solirubrobacteraceae bacterium]|nr:glycosyltransferase [Solirubrobacteraceae bacterium]
MRLLITVPWTRRLAGAERMLHTFLTAEQAREHELELVFLEDGPWPRELRELGLPVQVLHAGRLREAHRFATTVWRLRRVFAERRPDLILNWSGKAQLYGGAAAVLAGVGDRVVWWQHGVPRRGPLERAAQLLPARAIGCTSRWQAALQEGMRPRRPTVVVPAGIAPGEATEQARGTSLAELPADVPVVGMVGRLQPWKGQERLLRAQAILHGRGRRFHLLLVGGDTYGLSPQYAASLPGLIASLGLRGHVTLTGEVSNARPYVARMDILVNASDPEPFGIVLLEGMAAGVPVLAVRAGGPPEILDGGRAGVLVDSGEPEDLARGLQPLLESPALRRSTGRAGHARFMENYTEAAVRKRFFASLQALA